MNSIKIPLTFDEQIQLLVEKGLVINNKESAKYILSSVNYYRLINGYSLGLYDLKYPKKSHYKEGISLNQIFNIYKFDTELRHATSELLEYFELEFRTRLAYYLSIKYCSLCYLRKELFISPDYHTNFLECFERDKISQRKSLIIIHHKENYRGYLPLWAAVEVISFGTLSKLFCNLNDCDRKYFSKKYYGVTDDKLKSWLKAFVECRNICAHYGRLYNKTLVSRPKLFNSCTFTNKRIFSVLYLLSKYASKNQALVISSCLRIRNSLNQYKGIDLHRIGFPEDWFILLTGVDF